MSWPNPIITAITGDKTEEQTIAAIDDSLFHFL